jgi:hypothetical protein
MAASCFQAPLVIGVCVGFVEREQILGTDGYYDQFIDCAKKSADCTTMRNCVSHGQDASFCAMQGKQRTCKGDVIFWCMSPGDGPTQIDCAARGEHCQERNGLAVCTTGAICDVWQAAHCDGNYYVGCDKGAGLLDRYNCIDRLPGSICVTDQGLPDCVAPGPACSPNNSCEGTTLLSCIGGIERKQDCARLGGTCSAQPGGYAYCALPWSTCPNDWCEAGLLHICVDGTARVFDCKTIAGSACVDMQGAVVCR